MRIRWRMPVRSTVVAMVCTQSSAVPTGWMRHSSSNGGYVVR
ncbi:hypothetical protein [Actinoallomurus sp. NPDC052274]